MWQWVGKMTLEEMQSKFFHERNAILFLKSNTFLLFVYRVSGILAFSYRFCSRKMGPWPECFLSLIQSPDRKSLSLSIQSCSNFHSIWSLYFKWELIKRWHMFGPELSNSPLTLNVPTQLAIALNIFHTGGVSSWIRHFKQMKWRQWERYRTHNGEISFISCFPNILNVVLLESE